MTQTELEAEDCFEHSYEFLELLPSHEEDVVEQLFVCIHCGHTRVLHTQGVRDYS
jgi:hypothetical protein